MAANPQPRALGTIRNYVLLEEIGGGAHGTVYRAHPNDRESEIVALKIIEDSASIDRLLVEPQLLSKLSHPNVIRLQDYFLYSGKVVLVMEYVGGGDLTNYARQHGPFSCAETRELLGQLAKAVGAAHQAGIFHSDIKPQNVLVDLTGARPRYVLADFGVSRLAGGIRLGRYIAGTCSFMAPEQLRGRGTQQSDLWALGAMAYLVLTGKLPFPASTMDDLRREILYDKPPLPPALGNADGALERAIVHLLEKDIVDRTQSAEELIGELSSEVLEAVATDSASGLGSEQPQWETSLEREIARRRRRIVAWAIVASLPEMVSLVGCLGAWLIYRGQTRKRVGITMLGFAACAAALVAAWIIGVVADVALGRGASIVLSAASFWMGLFALAAAAQFVRLRQARRELTLVRALRTREPDHLLASLREYVTATPGDMNVRRRYIEALMASQRAAEAAVEARLVLEIDPYNIAATLFLAHAYLELGLLDRCEQVCTGYLEISSQCFEFEDLLATVKGRRRAAT